MCYKLQNYHIINMISHFESIVRFLSLIFFHDYFVIMLASAISDQQTPLLLSFYTYDFFGAILLSSISVSPTHFLFYCLITSIILLIYTGLEVEILVAAEFNEREKGFINSKFSMISQILQQHGF